ncbi:28S ribosomal protein S14, mitochondrial [Biomphalaria glabrata]|nr:28S ribosomal protein S14, mitochondrial [Biomphalaria glabrata]
MFLTQLFSSITSKLCKSLLQISPINSHTTTAVNTVVPARGKCFEHHFLNRWMIRDYKRRLLVQEHSAVRQRLVAIKRCSVLPKEIQEVASQEIAALPRDAHPSRLRNRCILTSRPRWVIWRFRLSRIQWRLLADYNKMSGVLRACW